MTTLAFLDTETTGLDPDHHEIWEVGLILRTYQDAECERPAHADGHHLPGCHAYDVPTDTEYIWQLPVDLSRADPIALNIGRFHDRRASTRSPHSSAFVDPLPGTPATLTGHPVAGQVSDNDLPHWAERFVELTRGAHLVGAVISFDAERVWRLLRHHGQCPMWHYHLVDVEALTAGYLSHEARQMATTDDQDRRETAETLSAIAAPPWSSEQLSRAIGVDPDQYDRHTALGDARWARDLYDAVINRRTA